MTSVVVEIAEATKEATDEIFQFQLPLLPAVVLAPIEPDIVYKQIWAGLSSDQSVVLNARREGALVGSLCLYEAQLAYSSRSILRDKWFAIADGETAGEIGPILMRAAREIAETRGMVLLLTRIRPNRRHPKGLGVYATVEGFIPIGTVMRIR